MQAVVQKWGNSLGFRIPSFWAKDNDIKNGSKVEVIAEKGKIIILSQKKITWRYYESCYRWKSPFRNRNF